MPLPFFARLRPVSFVFGRCETSSRRGLELTVEVLNRTLRGRVATAQSFREERESFKDGGHISPLDVPALFWQV